MKRLILLLFLCFVLAGTAFAQSSKLNIDQVRESGLTREQAKQMLIVVLKHEGYHLNKRGMVIDALSSENPNSPLQHGFWGFGLYNYHSGDGWAVGGYAVSKFTGDVWEDMICKRYNFPELRQLQTQIMQKTKKSFADEKEDRSRLGCTDE